MHIEERMTDIRQRFSELKSQGVPALIPYLAAGEPDIRWTLELLREFDRLGCAVAEIGIPYSDPIADGPVIQAAYQRSLERGFRLNEFWNSLREMQRGAMPYVAMVSYAMIHRRGVERFVDEAMSAGIGGLIVPDLLIEEGTRLAKQCKAQGMSLIQLVTPTTPPERVVRIAEESTGFLYVVSVTGITGERQEIPPELLSRIEWLRGRSDLPICVGFGISTPQQVKALAPHVDGIIVGSAIVRLIAKSMSDDPEQVVKEVVAYVETLIDAMKVA